LLGYSEMKKRNDIKKEVKKIKKTEDSKLINEETKANQTSGKKYVRIGKKYVRILNLSRRHIINSNGNGKLQKKKKNE